MTTQNVDSFEFSFNNEVFSDCVVAVTVAESAQGGKRKRSSWFWGSGPERADFHVTKALLARASPVFRKLIEEGQAQKDSGGKTMLRLNVEDAQAFRFVEALLRHIYTKEVSFTTGACICCGSRFNWSEVFKPGMFVWRGLHKVSGRCAEGELLQLLLTADKCVRVCICHELCVVLLVKWYSRACSLFCFATLLVCAYALRSPAPQAPCLAFAGTPWTRAWTVRLRGSRARRYGAHHVSSYTACLQTTSLLPPVRHVATGGVSKPASGGVSVLRAVFQRPLARLLPSSLSPSHAHLPSAANLAAAVEQRPAPCLCPIL